MLGLTPPPPARTQELSKVVPGKIGSTVVLGFRSADNNAFYDVELLREVGAAVGAQVL